MKKLELNDQIPSRSSVPNAKGWFRFQKVKTSTWSIHQIKFGPQSETNVEEEPRAVYSNEKPCSSRQVDA